MKRKLLLTAILLFLTGLILQAAPVSIDAAKKVALNYFGHQSGRAISPNTGVEVYKTGETSLFYVFTFEPKGFIIVAADDAVIPVLGYSTENVFDVTNIPVNMQGWLDSYKSQIKKIIDYQLDNVVTKKEWEKIQSNRFSTNKRLVTPLCSTQWDQGCYYNALCPSDAAATQTCGQVYTGCVATAMAQIMKYWGYPSSGTGSHSYTHSKYGTQTVDYATATYDWSLMPAKVISANAEVAKLMYHCGVSVNMNYGVDGSGAQSSKVPSALINNFGYASTVELKSMSDFTASGWVDLLKAELDAARPVYYAGDDGVSGHAFVCDGYDGSNKFHFNWGWSGYGNGYFAIGSLNPMGSTFNQGNEAIVRVKPLSNAPIANFTASNVMPAVGGTVNFTDKSTQTPTAWKWTFEGGNPATSTEQNPQNIAYATAGAYTVTLTVSNASGDDVKTMSKFILVGGSSDPWIRQNTGFNTPSRGIDQIKIVSSQVVWAKAYDGTDPKNYIREFTKTTDGGITWTPGAISFTDSENYGVSNIFPFSDLICYACMFPIEGYGGKIVKTVDGGVTWTVQSSATFTSSWANFVHFFNTNEGVAMGDPVGSDFAIYTTSNGGESWQLLSGANIPNSLTNEAGVTNMYYSVENTIWFSTSAGRVYKSTDKGMNWTVATTGLTKVATLSFKDANTGFAILSESPYTVKKTVNGGSSWTSVNPAGYFVKSPRLSFLKGTTSTWIDASSGPGKGSSFSLDDCATFSNIDTGKVQYTEVEFFDKETGWAGSFNTSSTVGGIYKWNSKWLVVNDVEQVASVNDKVRIYPNPTKGEIAIELINNDIQPSSIIVYSIVGAKVREIIPSERMSPYSLNLSGLKTGIYIVSIVSNGKVVANQRVNVIE